MSGLVCPNCYIAVDRVFRLCGLVFLFPLAATECRVQRLSDAVVYSQLSVDCWDISRHMASPTRTPMPSLVTSCNNLRYLAVLCELSGLLGVNSACFGVPARALSSASSMNPSSSSSLSVSVSVFVSVLLLMSMSLSRLLLLLPSPSGLFTPASASAPSSLANISSQSSSVWYLHCSLGFGS